MVTMDEVIRQLAENAQAFQAFTGTVSAQQALWKPDENTWSLQETMRHVYYEEIVDFRMHLQEMLSDPQQDWGALQPAQLPAVESLRQALTGFMAEREASLRWLRGLQSPDWERQSQAPWGSIRAGDVLVSWVEHDYLHLRQIIELQYAWNEHQAGPYSVEYAGGWVLH